MNFPFEYLPVGSVIGLALRAKRSFGFILLAAAGLAAAPAERPNVLFIALDDLRVGLGCYGDTFAITPHIDRLAARGTQFMRAYCAQAVCNPSRASTMTGRRPDTIRVWDLSANFRKTTPDAVPIPEYFKQHGYETRCYGKIYHGSPGTLDPKSWSQPAQFEDRKYYYALPGNAAKGGVWKQSAAENADVGDEAYVDGKVAAAAVAALEDFAKSSAPQPFFLAVGIRKPHVPFNAPKRYWDMYAGRTAPPLIHRERPKDAPNLAFHNSEELRGYRDIPKKGSLDGEAARLRLAYYASTTFADAQVGRVLDALDRTGLGKNTIVVLWSDHGYHMGEFGLWTKNTNYEAATRVPLIIATPHPRRTGKVQGFVELIDLYPTLTELCGLRPPDGLEGRSLGPNLADPDAPAKTAALSQFIRPWPAVIKANGPDIMGYSIRTAHHRYTEWRRFKTGDVVERELYAYESADEIETVNLAGDLKHAARLAELAALLPRAK